MTLSSLMISVLLGAIVIGATAQVLTDIMSHQMKLNSQEDVMSYMADLQTYMRNPQICKQTLQGRNIGSVMNAPAAADLIIRSTASLAPDPACGITTNDGKNYYPCFDDIPITNLSPIPNTNIRVTSSTMTLRETGGRQFTQKASTDPLAPMIAVRRVLAEWTVATETVGTDGTAKKQFKPVTMRIPLIVDATNIVRSCYMPDDGSVECTATGGIYVPAVGAVPAKCLPSNYCQNMGSFTKPANDAAAPTAPGNLPQMRFPNPFVPPTNNPVSAADHGYRCPTGFTHTIQSGVINEAYSCGKYRFCNRAYPVVNCVACAGLPPGVVVPNVSGGSAVLDFNEEVEDAFDEEIGDVPNVPPEIFWPNIQ